MNREFVHSERIAGGRIPRLVQRLFRDYGGSLEVHLWDGVAVHVGVAPPAFTLIIRDPAVFREMVLHRDPLMPSTAFTYAPART